MKIEYSNIISLINKKKKTMPVIFKDVLPEWLPFFTNGRYTLSDWETLLAKYQNKYSPVMELVLHSFTLCPPSHLKILFVTHMPLFPPPFASGYSVGLRDCAVVPEEAKQLAGNVLGALEMIGAPAEALEPTFEQLARRGVLFADFFLTHDEEGSAADLNEAWAYFSVNYTRKLLQRWSKLFIVACGAKVQASLQSIYISERVLSWPDITEVGAGNEACLFSSPFDLQHIKQIFASI